MRILRRLAVLILALLLAGCSPRRIVPRTPASAPAPGAPRFVDRAKQAGLTYRWKIGAKRPLNILQTIGNGCAFLDFDNDGNLDILLVGEPPALFRGDGKGHFVDVTEATLGKLSGHFLGCAVGDFDNDGFMDLYLSGYRTGRLLRNAGGRRFAEVNASSGIALQPWGMSASWADIDGDGWLDLFVTNYIAFGPETKPQLCTFPTASGQERLESACGPRYYTAEKARLYRNLGDGRFVDATAAWGADAHHGKGLGVAAADFDGDGGIDLAVANDETDGNLFVGGAGGKLHDIGVEAGVARDRDGNLHAGMGIDWGDYDNDGRLDFILTTFRNEAKSLYRNNGERTFTDVSYVAGIARPAFARVAFGVKFLDVDNDGRLDLLLASGHIQDNVEKLENTTYRQPLLLLQNRVAAGSVRYDDITAAAGLAALPPIVGRGLAVGDYDNDGKVDALVVDSEGAPQLLHNETPTVGHWLRLRLEGRGRSNRSAYGALVTAEAGGRTLLRHCQSDGSYLSASDPRVWLGLGAATGARVTVRWPSGRVDRYPNLPADRTYRLREGEAAPVAP